MADRRVDSVTGRYRAGALAVLDALTAGPQILVGSSMGAWIALLVAAQRPNRVAGFLFIAPAIDFTESLWTNLPADAKRQIEETGVWLKPSAYDPDPYPITRDLIEDGRGLIGKTPKQTRVPMRILQGMQDPDVPWQRALKLVEGMEGDVRLTLLRGGDHRLSKPAEIRLIERELSDLIANVGL
jgi:pimeloyl-ACP methyl ester carboxylesterase